MLTLPTVLLAKWKAMDSADHEAFAGVGQSAYIAEITTQPKGYVAIMDIKQASTQIQVVDEHGSMVGQWTLDNTSEVF